MSPDYKANREHNPEIRQERDAAEYILQKCGISVLAYPGYEADDIIYTLVNKLHDRYDKIYIYTGDSDLYFLVDEKVSIRPSSSKAKSVDINTYEKTKVKGNMYRYNSIPLAKICGGDSSDNIAPLPPEIWSKFSERMFAEALYPHMGNKELVTYWCSSLCPEALYQVDLVFPLDVPNVPLEFSEVDMQAVKNWGDAINNKIFRGAGDPNFDVKPYIEDMQVNLGIYTQGD